MDIETIATRHGELRVEKEIRDGRCVLDLGYPVGRECLLHWGLARSPGGPWQAPPEAVRPQNTRPFDGPAVRTPFSPGGAIHIEMEAVSDSELRFALYFPQADEWDNNQGKDYRIALSEGISPDRTIPEQALQRMAAQIVEKETGRGSWTLMHRYNLCYELLEKVESSREGLALLFVWLRFSALRQLDWQRNYNTQPRELSHAQQRLTARLAQLYVRQPAQRDLVRLMLTTMGHGGEGQRIRDEILEIMHRYGIREVSENFMEQWHQKMHNNTTPDDIVICEAYLAFLRANGNPDAFYGALEAGGVSRSRLESFERPIVAQPDFYSDKKERMIADFEHFLGTLKSVHSAADLGICLLSARPEFDDEMHRSADYIWGHRDSAAGQVLQLFDRTSAFRGRIAQRLESGKAFPDLLCLDVALEDFLRTAAEKNMASDMQEEDLLKWLALLTQNYLFGHQEQDLSLSLLHWKRIRESGALDTDRVLQADAVLDRMERTAGETVQTLQQLLQPKAENLGNAFHADPWTIRLFAEEIVRGGLIFALSRLCRRLRPLLRKRANLTPWQLVSPGRGKGIVQVMESLDGSQGRRFDPPVLIISERLRGDEDLPQGVRAVLTPDSVDVVSHVAIRARNQGILLATCYDAGILEELKASQGRPKAVEIGAAGELRFLPAEDFAESPGAGARPVKGFKPEFVQPPDAPYAVSAEEFRPELVGRKSLNLNRLQGKLPEWIHLPASAALPFAAFGKVIDAEVNREVKERYARLAASAERDASVLPELRRTILDLKPPDDLFGVLRERMAKAGLALPQRTDRVWKRIKQVWASKWNDRAYWNRKGFGIPHENLLMAVLVQEIVPAQYAYIIHTAHPFSGNREEIYAEVVLGLGETLAGNYPGRAFGFTYRKDSGAVRVLNYPSKSIGLYGGGLILRSDSNGEDLAGLAGAGLYSSFQVDPPEAAHLNYADERLLQDKDFRDELFTQIGRIGIRVEQVMDAAQDIEGAFAEGRHHVLQTRPQVGLET